MSSLGRVEELIQRPLLVSLPLLLLLLLLSPPSAADLFNPCPESFAFDLYSGFCVNGTLAVTPLTVAMEEACMQEQESNGIPCWDGTCDVVGWNDEDILDLEDGLPDDDDDDDDDDSFDSDLEGGIDANPIHNPGLRRRRRRSSPVEESELPAPNVTDILQITLRFHLFYLSTLLALKGPNTCLPGSYPDPNNDYLCIEDTVDDLGIRHNFVTGLFDTNLVRLCIKKGGGLMCYTQRWQRDFYTFLITLGGSQPAHCDDDNDGRFNCEGDFFFFFFLHKKGNIYQQNGN